MRSRNFAYILFVPLLFSGLAVSQDKQVKPLPTSKQLLLPVPGAPQKLNNFPQSIAVSPDGRYAAVLNNGRGTAASGFQQSIAILDLTTNQLSDFPDARLTAKTHQTFFVGLAFSSRGDELFASFSSITDSPGTKKGDTGSGVAVYSFHDGRLTPSRFLNIALQEVAKDRRATRVNESLPLGKAYPYPAGLAVVPAHSLANASDVDQVLVANNHADNALLLDAQTGAVVHTFDLSVKGDVPRLFPFGAIVVPNSSIAYVSLWNSARVAELDLANRTVRRVIKLDHEGRRDSSSAHASAMALNADSKYLFVALANRDRVVAVRIGDGKIVKTFSTGIAGSPAGAVPTALAMSGDRLFVADAGLDAVAVYRFDPDVRSVTPPMGFVPTEWYPTALASAAGGDLLVVSGKGTGAGPNAGPAQKDDSRKPFPYILTLQPGSLARLNIADVERDLPSLTLEVRKSNLVDAKPARIEFHPEVMRASHGGRGPIKHVIYVIKENRTYDQLLGDLGVGDGDPSLAIFGRAVTPNHHKLALQFGVLDNFYDSGEVSGVGHVWSTAATTSDYHERILAAAYKGEHTYDFEGIVVNGSPLQQKIPDVAEPATGYLWANAARHKLTYRHYGEFVDTDWCGEDSVNVSPATTGNSIVTCARKAIQRGEVLPANVGGGASPWPWAVPMVAGNKATKKELVGHLDPLYPDFKCEYPDQMRADEFLREFSGFVEARKRGKRKQELPELVVLRLPNDHTLGTRAKLPTPSAQVADNDLALGRVVEAVSHSPYWDDTAILVLEDDAQDGPDHVDAHRSLALVISKYSPSSMEKPFVEHDFYTTVNMIRTLEDLLGLPPMNQNDALASPMWRMFSGKGEQAAFVADYSNRDNGLLYQVNPENNRDAKASAELDFSDADAADAQTLNAIVWRSVKGDEPMPQIHTTFGGGR